MKAAVYTKMKYLKCTVFFLCFDRFNMFIYVYILYDYSIWFNKLIHILYCHLFNRRHFQRCFLNENQFQIVIKSTLKSTDVEENFITFIYVHWQVASQKIGEPLCFSFFIFDQALTTDYL